ncbi:MAG: FecR domain-containing protein, partial [Magnetococcales bacterium]|nr:FecR domain-containing protein [Magnetococcales bacterium]
MAPRSIAGFQASLPTLRDQGATGRGPAAASTSHPQPGAPMNDTGIQTSLLASLSDHVLHLTATEGDVYLPDASFLLEGEYSRLGDNLVIENPHGARVVVDHYFSGGHHPLLKTANEATVTPETVQALLLNPTEPFMVAGPTLWPGGEAEAPIIGQVDRIVGRVFARDRNGESRLLQKGDAVRLGDVVKTGADSLLKLLFSDGTIFQIGEDGRGIFNQYIFDTATSTGKFGVTILQGIFRYVSGKLAHLSHSGQHSVIKTPVATIGIRGSALDGEVTPSGETTVVHTAGVLTIGDAQGQGSVTLTTPGTASAVSFSGGPPKPAFQAPEAFIAKMQSQLSNKVFEHKEQVEQKKIDDKVQQQQTEQKQAVPADKKGDAPTKDAPAKDDAHKGGDKAQDAAPKDDAHKGGDAKGGPDFGNPTPPAADGKGAGGSGGPDFGSGTVEKAAPAGGGGGPDFGSAAPKDQIGTGAGKPDAGGTGGGPDFGVGSIPSSPGTMPTTGTTTGSSLLGPNPLGSQAFGTFGPTSPTGGSPTSTAPTFGPFLTPTPNQPAPAPVVSTVVQPIAQIPLAKGVFLDSAVGGLSYQTSSQSGVTDASGSFAYRPNETIKFYLGSLLLGESAGGSTMTPLNIAGAPSSARMTNILQILQMADADHNPNNGIQVSSAFTSVLSGMSLNLDTPLTASSAAPLTALPGVTYVSALQAWQHFAETLNSLNGQSGGGGFTELTLSSDTLLDNATAGTTIGTLSTTNTRGGVPVIQIVGGPDADMFEVVNGTLQLKAGAVLDIADNPTLEAEFMVTDANGILLPRLDTLTVTLVSSTHAPGLTGSTVIAANTNDLATPASDTIDNLFASLYTENNTGGHMAGVAVVGNTATSSQGVWQFSTDGGHTWTAIGQVNDGANAIALSATAEVRFLAAANFSGSVPELEVRALDDKYTSGFSSGSTLVHIDTSIPGGSTPISAGTATLGTEVAYYAGVAHLAGSISGTAANLAANIGGLISGSIDLTVTDTATVKQLTTLEGMTSGKVTVTEIADAATNLAADAATNNGAGTFVTDHAITVTDTATLSQLAAIDAAKGSGSLTVTSISDTLANLEGNAGGFVSGTVNVTVVDQATVAQLDALHAMTSGTITATDIIDTAAELAGNASSYIGNHTNVTITDTASLAQLEAIHNLTSGSVTVSAIADSAADLASNTAGYVSGSIDVTITDAATPAQLATIAGLTTGTLNFSTIGLDSDFTNPSAYPLDMLKGTYTVQGDGFTLTQASGTTLALDDDTFASGLTVVNNGTIDIQRSVGTVTVNGSASNGTEALLAIGIGGNAGEDATIVFANGLTNAGIIELNNDGTIAANSALTLTGGTLENSGTLWSRDVGASGSGTRTVTGNVTNTGRVLLNYNLAIDNTNAIFDTSAGTLEVGPATGTLAPGGTLYPGSITPYPGSITPNPGSIAGGTVTPGYTLTISSGTTRFGPGTTLLGNGTVMLVQSNLELTGNYNDLTPAVLKMFGGTVSAQTSGTLFSIGYGSKVVLGSETFDNSIDLANNGIIHINRHSGQVSIDGSFSNSGTATLLIGGGSETTPGNATVVFANGFTNAGNIVLDNSSSTTESAILTLNSGTLVNAGHITSTDSDSITGGERIINGSVTNTG